MAFMKKQLVHLKIDFERIEAINASDIKDDFYNNTAHDWNRPMIKAEVGCFLSHMNAWNYVVSQEKPFLVLEDDVLLSENLFSVLNSLIISNNYELINLETSHSKKLVSKKRDSLVKHFSLSRLYHNKTGAAAYVLFPEYAKYLIKNYKKYGVALADAAIFDNYFGPAQHQLIPAVAVQANNCAHFGIDPPFEMVSAITNLWDTSSKKSFHEDMKKDSNIIFKFKRYKIVFLQLFTYILNIFKSSLSIISFDK